MTKSCHYVNRQPCLLQAPLTEPPTHALHTVAGWCNCSVTLMCLRSAVLQPAFSTNLGSHMQGNIPDSVSISIEQAPLDWALPVRKEQNLRPPFRVSVVVKSVQPVKVPLKVTPTVLTEDELHNSTLAHPACFGMLHTGPYTACWRLLLWCSPPRCCQGQ